MVITMKDIITIDFDALLRTPLEKAFFMIRLDFICSQKGIECIIKETGKGLHVYIVFDRKLDFWEKIVIRSYLLDDPMRIEIDIRRKELGLDDFIDTLFYSKREHGKIKYVEKHTNIKTIEKTLFIKYSPIFIH